MWLKLQFFYKIINWNKIKNCRTKHCIIKFKKYGIKLKTKELIYELQKPS